jgi:hypothetical protein
MKYPAFIEIDGKRFVWRKIDQRRREQLNAWWRDRAVSSLTARGPGEVRPRAMSSGRLPPNDRVRAQRRLNTFNGVAQLANVSLFGDRCILFLIFNPLNISVDIVRPPIAATQVQFWFNGAK